MDFANICIGCMKSKEQGQSVCPHCGFDERTYTAPSYVLPPYTILNGKFLVGRVLDMGGFGITYVAMDLTLEHRVAIKEYFIRNVMYRNATESSKVTVVHTNIPEEKIYHISCEKFENEAKTLASLSDLPGIVRILEFFTEYNTAYIVMEYLSGKTLKEYVKEKGGKLSLEETREKLNPVMTSLQYVHERNIIHRDISPDNMKVLDEGPMKGHVKLFDFGGAGREIRSEEDPRSAIVLKKEGYTPMEQIAGSSNQGAWTDVYAMAATIYYCICGQAPLSVSARVADPSDFKRPSQLGIPITKKVEEVLLKGMTIQSGDRYQTMKEFQDALEKAGWGETKKRTMRVWPFMAAGGVAACIGIGLIINQVHNSARKEDNILEANAGKQIDTEKETVTEVILETETENTMMQVVPEGETEKTTQTITEQVKAQTETLEIVKTEDVTETMKESAEDSLKKGEWGELTQWISLRSQTTYGGKVIGRYKKGTKVKILASCIIQSVDDR